VGTAAGNFSIIPSTPPYSLDLSQNSELPAALPQVLVNLPEGKYQVNIKQVVNIKKILNCISVYRVRPFYKKKKNRNL